MLVICAYAILDICIKNSRKYFIFLDCEIEHINLGNQYNAQNK